MDYRQILDECTEAFREIHCEYIRLQIELLNSGLDKLFKNPRP